MYYYWLLWWGDLLEVMVVNYCFADDDDHGEISGYEVFFGVEDYGRYDG